MQESGVRGRESGVRATHSTFLNAAGACTSGWGPRERTRRRFERYPVEQVPPAFPRAGRFPCVERVPARGTGAPLSSFLSPVASDPQCAVEATGATGMRMRMLARSLFPSLRMSLLYSSSVAQALPLPRCSAAIFVRLSLSLTVYHVNDGACPVASDAAWRAGGRAAPAAGAAPGMT